MVEKLKMNKKKAVAVASVSLALILMLCAFTGAQDGQAATGAGAAETVYRESAVTRGDITVGVTENAVATLKTHNATFEIAGDIEEVFVKAGQAVSEGDPIASVTTDSIQEEIDSLQISYQEALVKLNDAQLSLQKGEITAQSSLQSSLSKGDTADLSYEITIDKLEQAIKQAEYDIVEINRELGTYRLILSYGFTGSTTNTTTETTDGVTIIEGDYDSELYDYTSQASYYSEYDKNFKDESQVRAAIDDANFRLESLEASLKEAKYNLEIESAEAELAKEEAKSTADLADTSYQLDTQSLSNTVTTRQLEVQNYQNQIAKYQEKLAKNILYAPCDGIVTAVNNSEGDSIQEGTTVAIISDSDNVYVYIAVAQDDITGITIGQECTVSMDAFETVGFDGVVDSITTTPARSASGSASYNVTIRLSGDTAQVYEGMTGSATLITRQQKDVLYVSNRTVYDKDGQSHVKVKNEDGTIEEVPVTTGFSDGRNVEITEGLREGQTVLIESQVAAQS